MVKSLIESSQATSKNKPAVHLAHLQSFDGWGIQLRFRFLFLSQGHKWKISLQAGCDQLSLKCRTRFFKTIFAKCLYMLLVQAVLVTVKRKLSVGILHQIGNTSTRCPYILPDPTVSKSSSCCLLQQCKLQCWLLDPLMCASSATCKTRSQ